MSEEAKPLASRQTRISEFVRATMHAEGAPDEAIALVSLVLDEVFSITNRTINALEIQALASALHQMPMAPAEREEMQVKLISRVLGSIR